jgi:DNA-binding response OmpR family regulator
VKKGTTSRRSSRPARLYDRREAAPEGTAASDAASSSDLPFSGRRILLVDDNAGISTLVAGLLQDAGATVDVSRSADAAVAQAVRRQPALAVIHLPLPKDGAAALSLRLRRQPALTSLPIMILSGEDGPDQETLEAADIVQPRPISPQRILEGVAQLLLRTPATEGEDRR